MNILVTGANGFVGRNLIAELRNEGYENIFEYDIDTPPHLLDEYCLKADFIFHLAGVNRPKEEEAFMEGNFGFTSVLLDKLKEYNNTCPVMISSSIQNLLLTMLMVAVRKLEKISYENIKVKLERKSTFTDSLICMENGRNQIIIR